MNDYKSKKAKPISFSTIKVLGEGRGLNISLIEKENGIGAEELEVNFIFFLHQII